ncbi:glycosyltransferase [Flammeovirgaceae bacterium KN852]|uniref:Glycosyltransferase n=1 Tax=Marinigracilibium pacificum TaxID=2729599 RepID=A0A848J851_9BACT|nr:glycosyltransferase [Marinigracilibium pacificum]
MDNPKYSVLIPTWNSLEYLKLCIDSINKNSYYKPEILIHVNEGVDGTLEWLKEQDYSFNYSESNIGVCWSLNGLRPLVKSDYIVFINDDMYVCPNWDKELFDEIESLPNNNFFLSSTLLQPRPFWCKSVISPADYGQDVKSFKEDELLKNYMKYEHPDWMGSTWPPNIIHRDIWDLVGGYSIEYSPGMYSDPDFSAKLWMAGIRYFKGISKSRVYHFEARSTGRVKRNNGSKQFLNKWHITSSTFMNKILKRGEVFEGPASIKNSKPIDFDIKRSKLKKILQNFGIPGNSSTLID